MCLDDGRECLENIFLFYFIFFFKKKIQSMNTLYIHTQLVFIASKLVFCL